MKINLVEADKLKTLEEYGASLLSSMISLKTLAAFQHVAFNKGLLDDDESETAKTILWEIERLLSLYKSQVNHVLDRTELKEEDILNNLRKMVPDVKIPRKKRVNKENDEEET
jgi:hypothetical protein